MIAPQALALILLFLSLLTAGPATAGGLALRFGPPGVGGGGPNPISIPPSFTDMGLSYVTDKGFEYNASLTALAIAKRSRLKGGAYISLGGGLAFSVSGTGFGPYAAFGYEGGCLAWLGCFSVEYNQALGLGMGPIVSPYGIRLGVIRWF